MIPTEHQSLNRLIAEVVMGWEPEGGNDYRDKRGWRRENWNPRENVADALEVLKRLRKTHRHKPSGRLPDLTIMLVGDTWLVGIGLIRSAHAPGDHFGAAACELARKWLEANANLAR